MASTKPKLNAGASSWMPPSANAAPVVPASLFKAPVVVLIPTASSAPSSPRVSQATIPEKPIPLILPTTIQAPTVAAPTWGSRQPADLLASLAAPAPVPIVVQSVVNVVPVVTTAATLTTITSAPTNIISDLVVPRVAQQDTPVVPRVAQQDTPAVAVAPAPLATLPHPIKTFAMLVAANIPAPVVAAAVSVVSGVPSSRLVPIIPIPALPTPTATLPTVVTTDVIAPCPHSLNDASSIAEPACPVIVAATPAKKPLTNSFHEFKPLASPSIAPLSSDATEFKPSTVPVTSASIAPVIVSGPATSPAAVVPLRREATEFVPKLSATEFVPSPAPLQSSQQQRTQNGDESFYHSNNSQYHQQNNTSHHQNNYSHQQQHQNHTNTYPSTVNAASTSTPVAATLVVPTTISTATAMPQVLVPVVVPVGVTLPVAVSVEPQAVVSAVESSNIAEHLSASVEDPVNDASDPVITATVVETVAATGLPVLVPSVDAWAAKSSAKASMAAMVSKHAAATVVVKSKSSATPLSTPFVTPASSPSAFAQQTAAVKVGVLSEGTSNEAVSIVQAAPIPVVQSAAARLMAADAADVARKTALAAKVVVAKHVKHPTKPRVAEIAQPVIAAASLDTTIVGPMLVDNAPVTDITPTLSEEPSVSGAVVIQNIAPALHPAVAAKHPVSANKYGKKNHAVVPVVPLIPVVPEEPKKLSGWAARIGANAPLAPIGKPVLVPKTVVGAAKAQVVRPVQAQAQSTVLPSPNPEAAAVSAAVKPQTTSIAPATVPVPIVEVLQSAQEPALQLDLKAVEHVAKPVQSVVPNHNQSQRHSAVAQAPVVHPAVESVHVPVVVPSHPPIHTETVHMVEPLAVVSSDRPAVPLGSPTEGASPASECMSPVCRLAEPLPEAEVTAAGMLVWSLYALMSYRHIPACVTRPVTYDRFLSELKQTEADCLIDSQTEYTLGGATGGAMFGGRHDSGQRNNQQRNTGNYGHNNIVQPQWQSGVREFPNPAANAEAAEAARVASLPALLKAENRYVRSTVVIEGEAATMRTVNGILNKLTPEFFEVLATQLASPDMGLTSSEALLTSFVLAVVEKVVFEPIFANMYARLCKLLIDELPEVVTQTPDDVDPQSPDGSVSPATEKRSNFRQILLGACQHEFEKFKLAVTEGTAEERTIQEKKNHKRALAAMQFLGELFVIKGVSGKTVIRCLTELRGEEDNADEENLEIMIKLWVLVGHVMAANSNSQDICAQMILALNSIGRNAKLSSRLRFMAQDTLELAANNWVPRRTKDTAKKLDDLRRELAEQEAQMTRIREDLERKNVGQGRINNSGRPTQRSYGISIGAQSSAKLGAGSTPATSPPVADEWTTSKPSRPSLAQGLPSGRTVKRVSFSDSNPNVVLQPNRQPTSSGAKKGAIKPVAQHSAHPGDDTIAPAHKNNTGFSALATDDDEFDDADIDEEDVDGKTDAVAKHTLEEDEDDVHINPVFAMVSTPKSKLHSHVHAHVESTEVTVVHLSDEDFRTECKNLMTEFFQLLDVNEAIARLKALHTSQSRHLFVKIALNKLADHKQSDCRMLAGLFLQAHDEGLLPTLQIKQGLTEFFADIEDVLLDSPKAIEFSAMALAPLLQHAQHNETTELSTILTLSDFVFDPLVEVDAVLAPLTVPVTSELYKLGLQKDRHSDNAGQYARFMAPLLASWLLISTDAGVVKQAIDDTKFVFLLEMLPSKGRVENGLQQFLIDQNIAALF